MQDIASVCKDQTGPADIMLRTFVNYISGYTVYELESAIPGWLENELRTCSGIHFSFLKMIFDLHVISSMQGPFM